MDRPNIFVTGEQFFLNRHRHLTEELSNLAHTTEISTGELTHYKYANLIHRGIISRVLNKIDNNFSNRYWKRAEIFSQKSKIAEETLQKNVKKHGAPDMVFHLFCTHVPYQKGHDLPFTIYTDYTMAEAKKNWPLWAPFKTENGYQKWIEKERNAYEKAAHIFTMGDVVRRSLINDYGISEDKISVVGAPGHCDEIYKGEKKFGSKNLLFNASPHNRKGDDLILDIFRKIRKEIPETTLTVIGRDLGLNEEGINNPGRLPAKELQDLFINSDLVIAPAVCEPYGIFIVESQNYGVPCIVSSNGGMESIIDHKKNGLVLNHLNVDEYASEAISLLQDHKRLQAYSQHGRKKIAEELNAKAIAEKMYQEILKICNK